MMSTGDHDDIRDLLEAWMTAMRAKDADGIIGCGPDTIRQFTLAPPLQETGNDRAGLQAWFDTWDGPLEFELRDTDLRLGGDIAWCSALAWLAGTKVGKSKSGFWFRLTVAFAREDGRWKIVHVHESVPFAMDGPPLAIFDLQP
jgi:ketosteroid isomerase-like protein